MADDGQLLNRPVPDRSGGFIKEAEVQRGERRLLEVVANDLVEFGQTPTGSQL